MGAEESGKAFIARLSAATGADIAASTDLTGSADLGGDWDLEHASGDIESSTVLDSDLTDGYSGLLAVVNVSQTADVLNGDTSSIANLLASDGGDGISLQRSHYCRKQYGGRGHDYLTRSETYALALGELSIASDITITGAVGGDTTIDGASISRLFNITSGIITISDLTIQNGAAGDGAGMSIGVGADVTLNNVVLSGNTAANDGGAIENAGTLSLNNVVLSGNTATGDDGGAINNLAGGQLVMTDVTLDNNTAFDNGGAIENAGVLQLNRATLSNNTAGGDGGAIFNIGTNFSAVNVTISGNTADRGGGLYESSSNAATLFNVTITDNTGTTRSGGVEVNGGALLTLHNTIIAGNSSPDSDSRDLKGIINSLGNNLIGVSIDGSGYIGSDILDVAPIFGVLAFNGGPTQTHALLSGSRGIDEGSNTYGIGTDQRGGLRDATYDIGAYESVPLPPVIDLNDDGTTADRSYSDTFTEGDAAVAVTDTDADVIDPDDTSFTVLDLVLSGFADTGSELVTIGGTTFTYGTGPFVTVTVGGTTFDVDYDGAESFGINRTGGGEMPEADLEALIRSITYEHTSDNPTAGDRTFSFTTNDGDTSSNTAVSTITVVAVNDPPVIDLNDDGTTADRSWSDTFTEGDAPVAITDADADVIDPDDTTFVSADMNWVASLTV